MRRALLLAALIAAGCGGDEKRVAPTGSRDCFAAWNGDGNEDNRGRIADEPFAVARMAAFTQIADFGEDAPPDAVASARTEGCSYLFHDDDRFLSLSGTWRGGTLEWRMPAMLTGSWSVEQAASVEDNATVGDDGRLAERGPPGPPNTPEPPLPTGTGPPPAWLETDRGSFWLAHSTFCWERAGCADYAVPSCGDTRHIPTIAVRRGELVTAHLGFEPRDLSIAYFPGGGEPQRLFARRDPVWRAEREGAFALLTVVEGRGDASYVACLRFAG